MSKELQKKTRGNIAITGRIVGLNNKEIRSTNWIKELKFGVMTTKDNMVYVQVMGFNKADDDDILVEFQDEDKKRTIKKVPYGDRFFLEEGETVIGTKIKKSPDGQVEAFVDVDSVQVIKDNFKDGDVVTIVANAEADTYYQGLKFNINRIYASSKEMDFEKGNFEEENHGRLWVAFAGIENEKVNGFIFDRKDEGVKLEFDLDTKYISVEDFAEFEQGAIIQLEYEYVKNPIYEDVEVEEKKDEPKFKPKGKYASEVNNSGGGRRFPQITGYTEKLVCTGISNLNTEEVIDLTPYLSIADSEEDIPF